MPGRRAMRPVPVVIMLAVASFASAAAVQAYDPLAKSADVLPPAPLSVADQKRDRSIPLLVSLPDDSAPAPVVLFSHGLGGSREGCGYLREHWAGAAMWQCSSSIPAVTHRSGGTCRSGCGCGR
jgi:predicted dienelactone hydrolase